jgi:hypothetical protein
VARVKASGRKPKKPRAKKVKAPKKKKFTRYDPETGRKVSVYEDDYRFEEWPERKPSKQSKLAAKIREHPVDYALDRASRVAVTKTRSIGRSVSGKLSGLAGSAGALATVGAAAAAAGILATAYVVADHIATNGRLALGAKVNSISSRYALAQKEIQSKLGASSWGAVPEDVRKKWHTDYTRAIARANSQAQGTAFAGQRESYK